MDEKLFGTILEKLPDSRQFISNEWSKGSILLVNGKKVPDESLKYNGFLDKFVIYRPDSGRQVMLNNEEISQVILNDRKAGSLRYFLRRRIKTPFSADSIDTYLELIAEGRTSLYAWRKMEYFPATNDYRPLTKYYLSMSDGKMYQVNPRNKDFFLLTGEEVLSSRFRKEGLNIRHENDFIRAVCLYNELLKTAENQVRE
jgi:hypothetical protein